jgi:uncharacterized DUF497 family protein
MKVIWDDDKDALLVKTRGISFTDFVEIILNKDYLDIVENQAHPNQMIFVCRFKDYTYCIPFVVSDSDEIVLKTIYPSRKFHQRYGGTE